jgi:phosphoribosylamine--glycine ligase
MGDLAQLLLAVAEGRMDDVRPDLTNEHSMTVIIAAEGYPGTPRKGTPLHGIEAAERVPGVTVFHAATARHGSGALLSAGGRVLAVTATGKILAEARDRVYQAVDAIDFPDGFHRRDIGWRELERIR